MSDFDINSLLEFEPPSYYCQKCCALNLPQARLLDPHDQAVKCPICGVNYVQTDDYGAFQVDQYLRKIANTGIRFSNPIVHGRSLAQIARMLKTRSHNYPPIRGLFAFMIAAKQFIHFTTYNMSHQFIGALKLVSQRIPVRGIVSGADAPTIRELKEFPREAPRFQCQIFAESDLIRDFPHQKLIVVDGLIAIKGSTNLSLSGWRKVTQDLELLEVVTNVNGVIDLNNRYFSPLWGKCSELGDNIEMDDIPF